MVESHIILIVTPNEILASGLQKAFGEYRYQTIMVKNETTAVEQAQWHLPSLILFDRQHTRFDTFQRHAERRNIPIVALQEPGVECAEEQCAADLERGLDACICNQSYRQVVARTRAIMRANQRQLAAPGIYRAGTLLMDIGRHEVRVAEKVVELTPREFDILRQFLSSPRVVLTRQQLLNLVWGEDYALEEHALDVHIHSLRHKIESNPHKPAYIVTVRGVGYKFQTE
jgi:DNA-binding response OmpR family regulator